MANRDVSGAIALGIVLACSVGVLVLVLLLAREDARRRRYAEERAQQPPINVLRKTVDLPPLRPEDIVLYAGDVADVSGDVPIQLSQFLFAHPLDIGLPEPMLYGN